MISAVSDVYDIAAMRAIMAYLRAQGGMAEIHAAYFELSPGEFNAALYKLKSNGRIRLVSPRTWEVVE